MKISMTKLYLLIIVLIIIAGCSSQIKGPKIYVANEGDGTISVIDEATLKVIKTIQLEGMPHNVNADPRGRYFYATNHEGEAEEIEDIHAHHDPYLRILDANKLELVKSVKMEEMAAHVVPSRTKSIVYVSLEGGNSIAVVDLNEGKIINSYEVGSGPHGFVLSNDDKTIYIPNMKSNDVSIVKLENGDVENLKLDLEGNKCETPVAMGITNDDKYSFVTCGKSFDVYKIDNLAKKVIARIAFAKGEFPGPIQTPVHPTSQFIYVPDMRNGVVHKIEINEFKLVKDIQSGEGAHGIAFSSDGNKAYVTNTWENTVSAIDISSDTIIKKIQVGSKPNGIAVSNGKNQGW